MLRALFATTHQVLLNYRHLLWRSCAIDKINPFLPLEMLHRHPPLQFFQLPLPGGWVRFSPPEKKRK